VQFNKVCRHAGGQALRLTGIEIDITTDASSDRAHILTSRRLQRPTGVEREVLAAGHRRRADNLRHVQGRGPQHGHRDRAPAAQVGGRSERGMERRGLTEPVLIYVV